MKRRDGRFRALQVPPHMPNRRPVPALQLQEVYALLSGSGPCQNLQSSKLLKPHIRGPVWPSRQSPNGTARAPRVLGTLLFEKENVVLLVYCVEWCEFLAVSAAVWVPWGPHMETAKKTGPEGITTYAPSGMILFCHFLGLQVSPRTTGPARRNIIPQP